MACSCGDSKLGSYLGKIGGQVGDRTSSFVAGHIAGAQKRFRDWTGLGDYTLHANTLINGYAQGQNPSIGVKGRATRIKYREYLGDVFTDPDVVGDFHVQQYVINPGNVITFPWLSGIASNYDQYKPLGVIFEFRSTATDSSTTPNLGSVIMATDYDVVDDGYTSKLSMLNSAYSNEMKMSDDGVHGLECDPDELQRKMFYVRQAGTTGGAAPRDYAMANFSVATQGGSLPVSTIVGSLYVHYEFEFYKEQLDRGIAPAQGLWNILDLPSTDVTTGGPFPAQYGWPGFEGDGPNNGASWLGPTDFGIFAPAGTARLNIPRRWQGLTFRIKWFGSFNNTAGWNPSGGQINGALVLGGLTILNNTGAATLCVSNGWVGTNDADNGAGEKQTYGCTVFKLDDIITEDYAFIENVGPNEWGFCPMAAGATAVAVVGQWTIEVVPDGMVQ